MEEPTWKNQSGSRRLLALTRPTAGCGSARRPTKESAVPPGVLTVNVLRCEKLVADPPHRHAIDAHIFHPSVAPSVEVSVVGWMLHDPGRTLPHAGSGKNPVWQVDL